LTFAEVRERDLVFVATLQSDIRQGELRGLTITLRNWEGGEVTLTAPEVSRRIDKQLASGGRAWVLELKPGVKQQYQLSLSGKIPLGAAPTVFLPEIGVETPGAGPVRLSHWVALAGSELAAEGATTGLAPVSDPGRELAAWAGEADRLRKAGGTVWKVTADDWRLRLRPRVSVPRAGAVEVFWTEHTASVINERRWLHQTTCWLHHDAGADLSVALPARAVLLGLAIDGVGLPPLQPADERLWLPLPGGAGVRRVRLCWSYAEGHEPFEAPILTGPKLEGASDGPAVWVVSVPPGYQGTVTAGTKAERSRMLSAAELDLSRAAGQLRLMAFLVDRARDSDEPALGRSLLAAQERFERLCRRAEYQLGLAGAPMPGSAPGKAPAVVLQELREQAAELARTPVFARLTADAKESASKSGEAGSKPGAAQASWMVSPIEQGRPLYWQGTAATTPQFRLVPDDTARTWRTLTWSALLLILLLASWAAWRLFGPSAWPEQFAVLGGCGSLLLGGGWALPFVLLPATWLGIRSVQAGRWARVHLPQRKPAAPEQGSSLGGQTPVVGESSGKIPKS
jgi:hypothetical protein